MTEERRLALHYFIRGILLGGFTYYVVHLVDSDRLQYYIAPRMIPYVKYSAMALFVLAAYFVYMAIQKSFGKTEDEEDCDCGHVPSRSVFRSVLLYGLFAVPLLLGFSLPDTIMGSDLVAVKGMNLNAGGPKIQTAAATAAAQAAALPTPAPTPNPAPSASAANAGSAGAAPVDGADAEKLKKLFPADQFSEDYSKLGMKLYEKDLIKVEPVGFLEMLTDLDMYKANFMGKKIDISGFIYREADMKPNQFVISRMAMTCCSADASPYGFLVNSEMGKDLTKDTWIHLTGVIGQTVYNGNSIIQLSADKIEKIKAPKDPYVYPYVDDYLNLGD
jgi:putative membrane protein